MSNAMGQKAGNTFSSNYLQALNAVSMHEQGRTVLASAALENIAALSAMEGYLAQIAPTGVHRYKYLLDEFTKVSTDVIRNW